MDLRPSPVTRQQHILAPRLYQGLKVLQLSATQLRDLIQQELTGNPALELPEPSDQDPGADYDEDRRLWQDYAAVGSNSVPGGKQNPERGNPVEQTASAITLSEYLSRQLDLLELKHNQKEIGAAIIGSLDADGYLRETSGEISSLTGATAAEVKTVLALVQDLDPPGIAARDLQECLLNQMDETDALGLPGRIVRECLPLLARGAHCEITRKLKEKSFRVGHAIALIRMLNPAPGAAFDAGPQAANVIPDIYISKSGDTFSILANREVTPKLNLSQACRQLADDAGQDKTDRDFIKSKIKNAAELIRDIEQRRLTLESVARLIAEAQRGFFTSGPTELRPVNLEDIARELDVHASTVSRAIQGKYMSTDFGVFEFKYFFASGCATSDGGRLAASAIKEHMGRLIEGEDRRRPLSDQRLAEELRGDNIDISRRTVAKYREAMGIAPSYQRKEMS